MTNLAVVWHWWLSFFVTIGAVGLVVGLFVMYLVKVQRPKYPRNREQ